MHDDDEKNEMEKQIEEMRRALNQVDPEQMREAFLDRIEAALPGEIARTKANFTELFTFLSRPIGSYDYKELLRVQAEAARSAPIRAHPRSISPSWSRVRGGRFGSGGVDGLGRWRRSRLNRKIPKFNKQLK